MRDFAIATKPNAIKASPATTADTHQRSLGSVKRDHLEKRRYHCRRSKQQTEEQAIVKMIRATSSAAFLADGVSWWSSWDAIGIDRGRKVK